MSLSEALKAIYGRTGYHFFHRAHNKLVLPRELTKEGEYLVIYTEQQGVSRWGIHVDALQQADPPVCTSAVGKDGETIFVPEFPSISVFICFQGAWQAVEGALPYVGVVLPRGGPGIACPASPKRACASRFGSVLAETSFAHVRYSEGAILTSSSDGYLGLAARNPTMFRAASTLIGIEEEQWDYATLRDEL